MRRLLEESMARNGMELRVALECHQLATANRLVAAGQGGSVVPSLLRGQVTALGGALRAAGPTGIATYHIE
jgi:LysR family transcriptional regulator, carnitine catabolism transcriptional activator